MIIVPHEDDEILMTGGIIARAVEEQKKVTVVMATNGDYEGTDRESGSIRLPETLAGLKVLGLSKEHVIFMGYADTGMEEKVSFLHGLYLETDADKLHPGHCGKETYALAEKPDYHTERYGEPAAYTRKNFKQDLRDILLEERPDCIYTTSKEDVHGDHSGLFLFVKEVLTELREEEGYQPTLFSALAHSKAGDDNWPVRSQKMEPFTCPEGCGEALHWEERVAFPVPEDMKTADLSKNRKAQALAKHKTALKEDAVEFLYSFLKSEEIFWNETEMEKKYGI